METLAETIYGSFIGFLCGIGSGCSLGLLTTVLLAEVIGLNVFSALVPFALLHTAIFITELSVVVGMEFDYFELKDSLPGSLTNLLSAVFNVMRQAQPLTITGAVIMWMRVLVWFFGLRENENWEFCLGQWGMIIAITSELKMPKTAVLTIITGVAMMAFGSTDGQHVYGNSIMYILYILLFIALVIPFVIIYLGNTIARSVSISDLCAIVLALTIFARPRAVVCFFTHIRSQYLELIKAIFKTVCLFGTITTLSFIIPLVMFFVGLLPHLFWGEDAYTGTSTIKTLCWLGFFPDAESNVRATHLKGLSTVLQMFAILDLVITLAVILGIAVSLKAQQPGMGAQAGLVLAWACTGAALSVAFAVRIIHGQTLLLQALAVSVLISACLFFIFKSTIKGIDLSFNNAPEVVKQLGWMYVATVVMGLGASLIHAWIGWTLVATGIILAIKTVKLMHFLDQDIQEDLDETD